MAPKPKLTPTDIAEIQQLSAEGMNQIEIAAKFGVDRGLIRKALASVPVPIGESSLKEIDYADIHTSSLNPRKTFDNAEIAELAESIATNGLLQNLVVRPRPEGGYTLVAGERRWRAIGALIEGNAGGWTGGVPCRVIEADDGTHLALALLENLHRQDVQPLEEADAFAQLQALDPERWTPQVIAEKIGRTPRFVYMRLAMANNLCADAKTLVRAGRLNVEGARLLAAEPLAVQDEIVRQQWGNWQETDADVLEIAIEEDDEPIDVSAIRGELNWRKHQEDNRIAYEARAAAHEAGALSEEDPSEIDGGEDEETPEEKSRRLSEAAQREAAWKKNQEEREAREAAVITQFKEVCYKLPTDWTEDEAKAETSSLCREGCKHRRLLNYLSPAQFHVCLNPNSPRAGLLTFEDQGGRGCFEV